jgi:5-formyltetrahydrofolate cyclo-ligase
MDKNSLRIKYKKLREELSSETIEDLSLAIANQTLKISVWNHTNYHLFLTMSQKQEVNTDYLLHILQGKDKSVIVSKSHFSTGEMTHYLLQENTVLKISNNGIPEPTAGIEIQPKQIDVVFVPLLGYDLKGNRIGYGKGFYDRFLSKCNKNAVFIGLSFFEPEKEIFSETTDVSLHYCVTPNKIYSFKNVES